MREFLPAVREHGALGVDVRHLLNTDGKLDLYPEVTGKNYLRAHLAGDTLRLTAGSFVGLIALNDRYAITVKPRVDVTRLSRLLRLSGYTPVALDQLSRVYGTEPDQLESILDLLSTAFLAAVDAVAHRGLRQQYFEHSERTSFPRGRILAGKTLAGFARGSLHQVNAAWFAPSVDTPENRLLKFALYFLASKYHEQQRRHGHLKILADINRLMRALDGVELDMQLRFLEVGDLRDAAPHRSVEEPYVSAIGLAYTIILNEGIDLASETGTLSLSSLLLNMEDVFERYIRETLRTQLVTQVPGACVLDGNGRPPDGAAQPLFADNDSVLATPDIVVRHAVTTVILELKYKQSTSRDDLNQIIGYGVSYGAKDVALVHLKTPDAQPRLLGSAGGIRVHSYPVDLSGDLEAEELALATFVSRLIEQQE